MDIGNKVKVLASEGYSKNTLKIEIGMEGYVIDVDGRCILVDFDGEDVLEEDRSKAWWCEESELEIID